MKIIGIAGTNGSGKDSLGEILAKNYGYMFVSGADFLRDEAKKRGLSIEREVLRTISAEWRRKYGLGVLVDKAFEIYKQSAKKYKGLVISPMRNPGEAQHLKELGGVLIWVDADLKVRYGRITKRQRSTEDQTTLSLSGVKLKADIFLENNGTLEEFRIATETALKKTNML